MIDSYLSFQLLVASILIKYSLRLSFRTGCGARSSPHNCDIRMRMFFLLEHTAFTVWSFYVIILYPGSDSWYFAPHLCWVFPPQFPSDNFHIFYIAKVGTHVEDVVFRLYEMWQSHVSVGRSGDNESASKTARQDVMMDVHHIATAALCILSYTSGYYLIGSLLMVIHDVSDIPLDLVRICMELKWDIAMYISYAATLVAWAYFRLYYLGAVLLHSVVLHPTTSFIYPCKDARNNPKCQLGFYAELSVYVVLIGSLWILHIIWYWKMLAKGYRLLVGKENSVQAQ